MTSHRKLTLHNETNNIKKISNVKSHRINLYMHFFVFKVFILYRRDFHRVHFEMMIYNQRLIDKNVNFS